MNLDYLTHLNKSQEEAVLNLNGPLLIVAGAGSGKTRVLTAVRTLVFPEPAPATIKRGPFKFRTASSWLLLRCVK